MRVLSLTALAFLVPALLAAQAGTATITGTVRDEVGQPVRDAVVVLDADSTALRARTDAEGRFTIAGVAVGRRDLQVVRIGYRPHRAGIEVPASGLDITVTLERLAIQLDTVSVRVTRTGIHGVVSTRGMSLLPHEPRPLRGAIIEILDTRHRTTTDRDGRFSIDAVGEGAWSILVRADRHQSSMTSVYVPPEGGLDVNIVLDSTIADWQRREDLEFREISRRLREANNPSAFVSMSELVGPEGMTLKEALRVAPSTLSRGLLVMDDVACVYVDGNPRPGLTVADILAEEVQAVEVYGIDARGRIVAPIRPWLLGTHCGTGTRMGPFDRTGVRTRLEMDNWARVVVVWLKRGRRH